MLQELNSRKKFRERNPGFVIDIHDALADNHTAASSEGETVASLANHLHQSDLLVLDYNLEGAESGLGGAKAKEILKSVLSNQHFNLIVIHTGEESLQNVAEESLMSLLGSCTSKFSPPELIAIDEIQGSIDDLDATGDFDRVKFDEVFNRTQYLLSRKLGYKQALSDYMAQRGGPLSPLADFFDGLGLERRQKKVFLLWAIKELEKNIVVEVREAHRQIKTDIKRVQATRVARKLAEEKLNAEEKKFKVGLSTSFNVLEFQEDLAEKQSNEIKAVIDYNKSLNRLNQVMARTLEEHDIKLFSKEDS